jgi:ABC-type transport system substrate-binding protein
VNPYGPNIEKGRRLLAEAGYPGGIDPQTGRPLEISMDVSASGGEERQLAEYEQRQFEQLGIRVRIIENTFARLQDKEKQGNFQMAGSGWGADYPDAENFLFLFAGSQFPPGGPNYARFDHPEYNRLFDQMQTMENTPERLAIIKQMNDILIDECPMILRFHKGYYVIGQPWAPTTHMNLLLEGGIRYRTVDPELREKKRAEWNPQPKWPIAAGLGVIALGVVWGVRVNRRRNV